MLLCCILFISCNIKKEIVLIPSNINLLEEFKSSPESAKMFYKNKVLVLSGKIDFISWPKDGKKLNHTSVIIGMNNFDRKTLDGDCIGIELDERRMDLKIGDEIKLQAYFTDYREDKYGCYISLEHGTILND